MLYFSAGRAEVQHFNHLLNENYVPSGENLVEGSVRERERENDTAQVPQAEKDGAFMPDGDVSITECILCCYLSWMSICPWAKQVAKRVHCCKYNIAFNNWFAFLFLDT